MHARSRRESSGLERLLAKRRAQERPYARTSASLGCGGGKGAAAAG